LQIAGEIVRRAAAKAEMLAIVEVPQSGLRLVSRRCWAGRVANLSGAGYYDATSKCESPRHRTEECFRRLSCTERRFSASYAPSSGVAGGRWPYSSPQPTAEVGLYWTEALKETPD
jgi:hypothetical protein